MKTVSQVGEVPSYLHGVTIGCLHCWKVVVSHQATASSEESYLHDLISDGGDIQGDLPMSICV